MIDIHVHLWDWADSPSFIVEQMTSRNYFGGQEPQEFFTTPSLLQALDEAGVDIGVLLPLRSESFDWRVGNEYIAEMVSQAPDRLIGFSGVSPLSPDATKELRTAIEEFGLRGLKLHPPMQMFDPGDIRCYKVYEMMESYGLPILFHSGAGNPLLSDRYTDPHLIDEIAVQFPDLKIILAHAGRFWYGQTLTMMRSHANMYVDISANVGKATGYGLLLFLLVAMKEAVGDVRRVLFASDYPWYTPKRMLDLLQEAQVASRILPEPLVISDEDLADILDRNARRLLELDE